LFVECDGVLFSRTAGAGPDAWEPNWDVVAAIERWQATDLGPVVVWSTNGADDAETWRRRVLPHLTAIEASAKDLRRPRTGDVLIDGARLTTAGTCYQPDQSFMVAAASALPGSPR
jgi:hypothetical protein